MDLNESHLDAIGHGDRRPDPHRSRREASKLASQKATSESRPEEGGSDAEELQMLSMPG
jgi:hypothetical protein